VAATGRGWGDPPFLGQAGIYGVQGTPAPGTFLAGDILLLDGRMNQKFLAFRWLWFGFTLTQASLNDLWEYSNGQWTWIGGSKVRNPSGSYGILGVTAPGNEPSGRSHLTDGLIQIATFWLFGGQDSNTSTPSVDVPTTFGNSCRKPAFASRFVKTEAT